jgi:predicted transcriptional regulator
MPKTFKTTSVRFTDEQRAKLYALAKSLDKSPNAVMGMLVDNAEIVPVKKLEVVSKLPTTTSLTSSTP